MSEDKVENVLGDLADIIWWIKGNISGKESCDVDGLGKGHIESLRSARLEIMKYQKEIKQNASN